MMLMIGRPVDPTILGYMKRTEQAVAEYQRLDQNRSWLQVAFAWIFAIVALLVLAAAVLIGLVIATQIARPIGRLIKRPNGCAAAICRFACRKAKAMTKSRACRVPSTA